MTSIQLYSFHCLTKSAPSHLLLFKGGRLSRLLICSLSIMSMKKEARTTLTRGSKPKKKTTSPRVLLREILTVEKNGNLNVGEREVFVSLLRGVPAGGSCFADN